MKVLSVDDNPINLRLLRAVLEAENMEVFEASDGSKALALLEQQPVDAIISDVLMPNMDGYRFCEEVRRSPKFYNLPFIIYTSTYNSPGDEELALKMGADKYLRKPAPIKDILAALNAVLHQPPLRELQSLQPEQELGLVKLYNATLVRKLEHRNQELTEQQEALASSEERFKQLAENINEIFWVAAHDSSEMLYISPAYERVWGRTCQSLYQNPRSFLEAIHPEDRDRVLASLEKLGRGESYNTEYRIIRPDGDGRWIHDRGHAIRNPTGKIYRVAGIAEDITERKQTENRAVAFSNLGHRLSAAKTAKEAAHIIVEKADKLLGWDCCVLELYSAESGLFFSVLTIDLLDGKRTEYPAESVGLPPTGRAQKTITEGGQLILRTPSVQPPSDLVPFGNESRVSASIMAVPIRTDTTVIGILSIQSYTVNNYDAADLQVLQSLADHCAGALERIQAGEELKRRVTELERYHRLSVGRELQMIDLKKEINQLAQQLGQPAPYKLAQAKAEY